MRELFALLNRVAGTDATVLLAGETGTGKELLAEAVHQRSARAGGPFVVVDCGALPHELIGSELFGHVRGAFTGATNAKRGLIEEADGGTLFLDEVGELPLDLQPQLLRVLEKREVRPVGDTRSKKVSIRVIAATHRDLVASVKAGTFREDLYFRLAVVRANVPPLRKRKDDIPLLVHGILAELKRPDFPLSTEMVAKLEAHDWPGNVRELRNVVERSLSLVGGELPFEQRQTPFTPPGAQRASAGTPREVLDKPFKEAKGLLVEAFEREYLTNLLDRHNGNISRAALEAGIDRNYIHRLVKKYGLPVAREK
jgi:transcriptional regulator with PAS, ATPase and Fis domain